jgi:hypothetical protein
MVSNSPKFAGRSLTKDGKPSKLLFWLIEFDLAVFFTVFYSIDYHRIKPQQGLKGQSEDNPYSIFFTDHILLVLLEVLYGDFKFRRIFAVLLNQQGNSPV